MNDGVFPALSLTAYEEVWPIAGTFTIARGSKTEARVIVAEVTDGVHVGRGEGLPYARYGETVEESVRAIKALEGALQSGITRDGLQTLLTPGAARNALDCALWDFEAKISGVPVWKRAGLPEPRILKTTFTLSLNSPEEMAAQARAAAGRHSLFKLKLAGTLDDIERIRAVREAAPDAALVADMNEGAAPETLPQILAACEEHEVQLVEQPLPAGKDARLTEHGGNVLICADESAHTSNDIEALAKKYDAVNIKLDKTGGLTEALKMRAAAREAGMKIMVGCMVSTSLSMAPAILLAADADYVDLDGALLLAKDREHGVAYEKDTVAPPAPALWG
jgi:L-alanine-DL-glutamate epimerase-like enolase superfamily enzyme